LLFSPFTIYPHFCLEFIPKACPGFTSGNIGALIFNFCLHRPCNRVYLSNWLGANFDRKQKVDSRAINMVVHG
jgi:hypothetical protein